MALLLPFLCSSPGLAQPNTDLELDFDRPESWGMSYFASLVLLTGYGPPAPREPGWIDIEAEIIQVPFLDEDYRRVGFDGVKVEDLNHAPVLLRPGFTFYLMENLSLSMSYLPPLELFNVKAHLLSGSVNIALLQKGPFDLGIRVYGQTGSGKGPFTCSEENVRAGNDFEGNPWGCTEVSSDTLSMDYVGAEVALGINLEKMRKFKPYLAFGWNSMYLKTELDSTLFGQPDMAIRRTNGNTINFTGGLTYQVSEKMNLGFQVFYSPLYVRRMTGADRENDSLVNLRAQFTYHFGRLKKRKNQEE